MNANYETGKVFTRIAPGDTKQTKAVRINLAEFEPNSENRRVLRKVEGLELEVVDLPMVKQEYHWQIHKLGKDFYKNKFDDVTFSATKIRELVTTPHNFNKLFKYSFPERNNGSEDPIGYSIVFEAEEFIHYAYPFYNLEIDTKNLGMGMMLKAILWAKEAGKKYIYLGSLSRPADIYKMQFKGVEVVGLEEWETLEGLLEHVKSQ